MKPLKFALIATSILCLMTLSTLIHRPALLEDPEPFRLVSRAHAQSSSISGLENVSTLESNYLFIIAIPGVANRNISYGQLTNLLGINTVGDITYITTQYVDFSIFTNVNVVNTFNVSGKATLSVVTMLSSTSTNGFFVPTNVFAGPTNTVDLATPDQTYASVTPCSVTGVINKSNAVVENIVMTFTNTASTNWLLTLDGGIRIPQRTNQCVVSNGTMATLSLRYHPRMGTNAVFLQF